MAQVAQITDRPGQIDQGLTNPGRGADINTPRGLRNQHQRGLLAHFTSDNVLLQIATRQSVG